MPQIGSGDLALLRAGGHRSDILLLAHRPTVTWSGRINDAGATLGTNPIAFDGGSGASFSLIEAYQEVLVGSSAGDDDIGRLRVRSVSSGDGGVTGTLTVAEHNLTLADNHYLTFRIDYPIKPVYPKIDGSGTFFKDRDIPYGSNYNDQPDPVCIAGDHRALRIDSGTGYAQFNVDASGSYAVASGATISSYAISVVATSGFTTSFDTGTGIGYVRFTAAGQYWVKFTCTDSNGKSQSTRRLYFVMPNDISDVDYGYYEFNVGSISGDWNAGGWSAQLQMHDDFSEDELEDQTLCIIWRESTYGSTTKNITHADDDSGSLFVGYATNSPFDHDLDSGFQQYGLRLISATGILKLYQYSVSLAALATSPTLWYQYASWMTVGRIIHHILRWHSTVLESTDILGLTDNTDGRAFGDIQDGSLYDMCNNLAELAGIRAKLVSDQTGRIHLTQDPQLLPDTPRNALTTVMDIEVDSDISGAIRWQEVVTPPVAMVKVSGIAFSGSFTDGNPDATAYCAVAPGTVPHDIGGSVITVLSRQVFTSQAHANQIAGRVFAAKNNRLPVISFSLHGNYAGVFDPAWGEKFTMDLAANQNPRGLSWSGQVLYNRRVDLQIDVAAGTIRTSVTMEPEATGQDGIQTDCLGTPTIGGTTPITPADPAGAIITAASVRKLSANASSWSELTAEATQDLIQDPFWRSRQGTTAPNSAILIRCGVGYIKRSTDGGQNWTDITPSGSPTNTAGDSPAPTWAAMTFYKLDASWIDQGTFVCIARWQNSGSTWRSWMLKTTNDGTAWTDVQISTGVGLGKVIDSGDYSTGVAPSGPRCGNVAVLSTTKAMGLHAGGSGIALYSIDGSYNLTREDEQTSIGGDGPSSFDAVSATRAIHVFRDSSSNGGASLWDDVSSVLTERTQTDFETATAVEEVRVVAISSTKVLVVWQMGSPATAEMKMVHGTISGNTITWGSVQSVATAAYSDISLTLLDSSNAVVTYKYDDGGGADLYGRVIDVSGTNPSAGAAAVLYDASSGDPLDAFPSFLDPDSHLATYNSTTAIQYYVTDTGASTPSFLVAFTISGTTINSVGTPLAGIGGSGGGQDAGITVAGTSIVEITHTSPTNTAFRTYTLSGVTISTDSSSITTGAGDERGWSIATIDSSAVLIIGVDKDSLGDIPSATLSLGGGSTEIKAESVAMTRATGAAIWVTLLESSATVKLYQMALSDLSISSDISLGSSSLAQWDAFTYHAFVQAVFGDDNQVFVHGRMQNPQSLGNPAHIIKSIDGGSNWTAVETGIGTSLAWALAVALDGTHIWVRNGGGATLMYIGGANVSTIPLNNNIVFPHGMFYDYSTGDVYLASGSASADMVAAARYPYVRWVDLTYDHNTASPVNAITLL